jgi:hypothetical protein
MPLLGSLMGIERFHVGGGQANVAANSWRRGLSFKHSNLKHVPQTVQNEDIGCYHGCFVNAWCNLGAVMIVSPVKKFQASSAYDASCLQISGGNIINAADAYGKSRRSSRGVIHDASLQSRTHV